jgi:hypothetical protein
MVNNLTKPVAASFWTVHNPEYLSAGVTAISDE